MFSKGFSRSLIGFFALLILLTPILSPGAEVRGSEPAKLGAGLASVLLRWNMVSSGFVSPGKKIGDEDLMAALEGLENLAAENGLPSNVKGRLVPLKKKLAAAEDTYLWPIQLGYWSFSGGDDSVSLSGAEVKSASPEARVQVFQYLSFGKEASATIDITKKTFSPPLKKFSLQLWVRPEKPLTGKLVETGDWELAFREGRLKLAGKSGKILSETGKIAFGNWTHVSLVVEGKTVKLYENGSLSGEDTISSPLQVTSELVLGKGFTGNLDEFRLTPKGLNETRLRFDQPLDYLIGFPIINWAQKSWSSDQLWEFYAGLLISNLTIKRDSEVSSLKADNLLKVGEFLLGEVEGMPPLPGGLPDEVRSSLNDLYRLGQSEKLTSAESSRAESLIERLVSYLDLA